MLSLDRSRISPFLPEGARAALQPQLERAHRAVIDGTGVGADMLGWRRIALEPDPVELNRVLALAAEIRDRADVLLCIGIGGSYLGAEAVIRALSPYFGRDEGVEVVFAGHHLSAAYHAELLASLEGRSVYVNVISKSGSTLEPALAFRFVRRYMESRFEDVARRIVVTTGPRGGLLNPLAQDKGYRRFSIPEDVGGRFSVLTPVGLIPIAAAGIDVLGLVHGAGVTMSALQEMSGNIALDYAADRYLLHEAGYTIELLAVFEPCLTPFGAWWQQLFGESEGKQGRGLFPAQAQYTTDLHSIGQYVQDGRRNIVETFLLIEAPLDELVIAVEPGDPDRLNYLAGRTFSEVNWHAYSGTAEAHREGYVPSFTLTLADLSARALGGAIAFFQHAVAVGGYLLGINPFDQPGVEAYKSKMFALLGKAPRV